jgi:ferredoxin
MKVDPDKCPQNHPCPAISVCKVTAISQIGFGLPAIDNEKCIDCGKCVTFCPRKAIIAS